MIIWIKVLKGEEREFKVSESTTILELKQQVQNQLGIPVTHQKLLFMGRTLVDDKTIESYSSTIKTKSTLTLVVKEPEPLGVAMTKLFRKYYSEDTSQKLGKEFMVNLKENVNKLSLDDCERLAKFYVDRDSVQQCSSVST